MAESTGDFRLSITRALADQLGAALERLVPTPLAETSLATMESRGGVYHLYLDGSLVYIGKADKSLPDRLRQHMRKISGRENISTHDMSFIALYVDEDLSAVAPETLLIKRHREAGALPWNFNGFGNKDPGRERDTSKVEEKHFDSLFPADLKYRCHDVAAGRYSVVDLLATLKSELPYVFRYQEARKKPSLQPQDYQTTTIEVPDSGLSANALLELVAKGLPDWQITALPGYVIMYKEIRNYASQRKVFGCKLP